MSTLSDDYLIEQFGGITVMSDRFDLLKEEYPAGSKVTDAEYTMICIRYPEMVSIVFRVWAASIYMFQDQLRNDPNEHVRKIAECEPEGL